MDEVMKEFEKWMIDKERFGPGTVETTLRKMGYVLTHTFGKGDPESMQALIREIWEKTSQAGAISAARAAIENDTHAQRPKEVIQ